MTEWRMERTISVSVVVAIVVQAAVVLLWAGRAGARIDDLDARLQKQAPVAERLARLEEQATYARAALIRIEDKLDEMSDDR